MGEELDVPIKTCNNAIDSENYYIKYGINQMQGWKKSMEDYTLYKSESKEEKIMDIFGIFDGHGGKEVPKYLSTHFNDFLLKNQNFINGKFKEALKETFMEIDKSFTTEDVQKELIKYSEEEKPSKEQEIKDINNLCGPGEKLNEDELQQIMAFNEVFDPRNIEGANIAEFTGSTAIIILLTDKTAYIANLGNSRCLSINKSGDLNCTIDHTMKVEEEKKRVDLARSFNENEESKKSDKKDQKEYLDSTRGFGDLEFKDNEWIKQEDQEISAEPEIIEIPLKDLDLLIIGSHGMFENKKDENDDNAVNKRISDYFVNEVKNDSKKISQIIEEFFNSIIAENKSDENEQCGLDNMSCIVIKFFQDKIDVHIQKIEEEEKRKKEEEEKKKAEEKRKAEEKKAEEKRKKEEEAKKKAEEEKKKKEEEEERKKKEEEEKKKAEENNNVINDLTEEKKEEDKKEEEKKEEEKKEGEEKKE